MKPDVREKLNEFHQRKKVIINDIRLAEKQGDQIGQVRGMKEYLELQTEMNCWFRNNEKELNSNL
jgi:hypothetical protein